MAVDKTGKHVPACGIDDFKPRAGPRFADGGNSAVRDGKIALDKTP